MVVCGLALAACGEKDKAGEADAAGGAHDVAVDSEAGRGDLPSGDECVTWCELSGSECGDDNCGGSCGECPESYECLETDIGFRFCFNFEIDCPSRCAEQNKECGSLTIAMAMDPIECDCGACPDGQVCIGDEPDSASHCCTSICDGSECGDDGCGGTCECQEGYECHVADDGSPVCFSFELDCPGVCGEWGAISGGVMCGPVWSGLDLDEPDCDCGDCPEGAACIEGGEMGSVCCTPDCAGKECGDDGCGGSCGACSVDDWCSDEGLCELATCSIITDCLDDCPEFDYACQDECIAGAPTGIQEAFHAWFDCIVIPPDCWCDGLDPGSPEAEECWDSCMDYCDSEYYACWPPGDGMCGDLYFCMVSCPEGDAGQSCADDCFDDASLDAQNLWDAFIHCLDDSGYFGCNGGDFKCYDSAWDQCLAELNGCLCDPECPEVLCEFESCDGLDNDCDGDTDEDFLKECNEDEDDFAACVDDDDDNDGLQDDKDNCPCDYNPDQTDHDCDCHGDICDDDDDNDGTKDQDDCAPFDYFVHPGHIEACDGVDNDCDDMVDENCQCVPDCTGKECGDDGCGGSCGQCSTECPPLLTCNDLGKCE